MKSKGSDVVEVATDDGGAVKPMVPAVAAAILAMIVGSVIWKRRR